MFTQSLGRECCQHVKGLQLATAPVLTALSDSSQCEWQLHRIGSSSYYQSEVGVLQDGFLPAHNFLLPFTPSTQLHASLQHSQHSHRAQHAATGNNSSNRSAEAAEAVLSSGNLEALSLGKGKHRVLFVGAVVLIDWRAGTSLGSVISAARKYHTKHTEWLQAQSQEAAAVHQSAHSHRSHRQRHFRHRNRHSTHRDSSHGVHALIGHEYECPLGHRFFLSPDMIDVIKLMNPSIATHLTAASSNSFKVQLL